MATTHDLNATLDRRRAVEPHALKVAVIALAAVTIVLVLALVGRPSGPNSRGTFTPYDWTLSRTVTVNVDSPYPAARVVGSGQAVR